MHTQNTRGFTLVELLVVTAISGFLVVSASSLMVSFSKFKYMADTQEQLKTEATFAANQIDLLIRNGIGLPDMCMATYRNDQTQRKFCDGTTQQISLNIDKEIKEQWGSSDNNIAEYAIKCTSPRKDSSNSGKDDLNTAKGTDDSFYIDQTSSSYCPEAENQLCTNSDGPYRSVCVNTSDFGDPLELKSYLITQTKRTEPVYSNPADISAKNNSSSTAFLTGKDNAGRWNPPTQNQIYNQIIYLAQADINNESGSDYTQNGKKQYRIGVLEYLVGQDAGAATTNNEEVYCTVIPSFITSQYQEPIDLMRELKNDGNQTFRRLYLTSNSVEVSDLTFDCRLANYSLPTQSATITYTLELRKKKKSLNTMYDNDEDSSFDTYRITRTVNVRNANHPFIFNQTGQGQ